MHVLESIACHDNLKIDLPEIYQKYYPLDKSKYIEDLEILNLHNYYESLLYKVNYFCREINLGKKINNIDFLTKN